MVGSGSGGAPPSTFRCALVGGAHTPAPLLERALGDGWPVALTYGMSEMSSQVATAPPELVRRVPGTVGSPLEGVEVRIGEGGEVLVRGPTRAVGYLAGTGPLTSVEGWYATGDLGRFDAASLERGLNRNLTQIVGRHGGEGAIEAADRRPGGAGDDDI